MTENTAPLIAEATGYSDDYSFDEAFRDALGKLPPPPRPFPDQIHYTQVMAIGSEIGGIAGFHRLYVRLRRVPGPTDAEFTASEGEVPFPWSRLRGEGVSFPPSSPAQVPFPLPTRRLYAVDSVKVDVLESKPPKYAINACGHANSSGWSLAQLRPVPVKEPPADGIYDFEFVAIPPSGMVLWVLTPICTPFPLVWQPDDGSEVRGIRVIAASNEEVVELEGAEGARLTRETVKVGHFDAGPPG